MSYYPKRPILATLFCGVAALWLAQSTLAEDAENSSEKSDHPEKALREQSIYIPYEKLRKVFEKEGRGVFLPYEKFQELWQAAQEKTRRPEDPKPPVGAVITEVQNEATVSQDVIRVEATAKIEILAEGWHEVPLRLAGAAITKATVGEDPARITAEGDGGYKLLIHKEGKQPEQIELALQYSKAIVKAPGRNSVSFEPPQAPVSRWRVRIPEAGVKVNIHPLIAASEVPVGDSKEPGAPGPGETVVLAFVGAAPTVRIEWTPKAEGATGLEALASVQAEQQVTVNEGVMRTQTQLAYTISRAELSQLLVEAPADHKVVNVFDANVRQWSVEKTDDRQKITVELFEPATGSQSVTVELEKFTDEAPRQTLKVPVIKAMNTGRQQGVVVVRLGSGLRAEATRQDGLLQVDATELPGSLARGRWAFSWRYAAAEFNLELAVEKIEPHVVVDSLVHARVDPQRLLLDMLAVYTVERAGVFGLELDVPAGYEVRQVRGHPVGKDAKPAAVDAHHLEGEQKTRLVVNLSQKAMGRVGLHVQLQKEFEGRDLYQPAKSVELALPIPRIAPKSVQRATGRLLISAPESLRVNPLVAEGLRSISFSEAQEGIGSVGTAARADERPVLAFAYTQEPVKLSLAAERRKPQVTIGQLLVMRIADGVVKYEATFFYNVLYSGVESLRIDVPAGVAKQLRNKTKTVQEKQIEPPPEDLADGYVAWSLTGETEFIGEGKIELVWEDKGAEIKKLDVGKSIQLAVPRLVPREVDRAWGQIVLGKAETIDIHPSGEPKALRPIDPQHDLMPGADVTGAARAFEFHKDWALTVTATRYELEEVKRTSIERAVLRLVGTRSARLSVQALYRMQSARQRLVVKLPAEVKFDSEPLRINGRPVTLEKGAGSEFFIPLAQAGAEESLLVDLRYTLPWEGRRLDCPEFPSEPAVQKVYLCLWLPEEQALLNAAGPWTEEFRWRLDDALNPNPITRTDGSLVSWVCNNQSTESVGSFQTDGRLYVFSTLRPGAPPEGSLRVWTADEDRLSIVVLLAVAVVGLLLLPLRAAGRVFWIGLLIIALVVLGVFMPILVRQILDGATVAAVCVVGVMWVVWYFVRTRPRDPAVIARRQAKTEAIAAVAGSGAKDEEAPEAPEAPVPAFPEPLAESQEEPSPEESRGEKPSDDDERSAGEEPDSDDEGGQTDA